MRSPVPRPIPQTIEANASQPLAGLAGWEGAGGVGAVVVVLLVDPVVVDVPASAKPLNVRIAKRAVGTTRNDHATFRTFLPSDLAALQIIISSL